MENNYITYKRVKINWWPFILFAYVNVRIIYQFGTNPMDNPINMKGLIAVNTILVLGCVFVGRFKVIIDDNFAVFRTDVLIPIKISIFMIDKVSIMQNRRSRLVYIPFSNVKGYQFDYLSSYAVSIQLKNE